MHIVHRHDGDYDLDNSADVDRILAEFDKAHKEGTLIFLSAEEVERKNAEARAYYDKIYGPDDPADAARIRAIVDKQLARIRAANARAAAKARQKPSYSSAPAPRPTVPLAASA
jgi:hypothetical protein